jgi:hypothetical protein
VAILCSLGAFSVRWAALCGAPGDNTEFLFCCRRVRNEKYPGLLYRRVCVTDPENIVTPNTPILEKVLNSQCILAHGNLHKT